MSPRGRGRTSRRMLVYHSVWLEAYNENDEGIPVIPVIPVVIYPVEGPGGEPYLVEEYGSTKLLSFQYQELWLRTMEASAFTRVHAVPLKGTGTEDASLQKLLDLQRCLAVVWGRLVSYSR